MRQSGEDPSQVLFRQMLLQLRDGQVTEDDWRHFMSRTPAQVSDLSPFTAALRLFPTTEAVVEHNVSKLYAVGQPIATIKAVHTGPNAAKASSDDASGLEPIICLAVGARVMLSSNLWVNMGLVNGAMGTIKAICYHNGAAPPDLPVAVTVQFDTYSGPTLPDGTVPIAPLHCTWSAPTSQCSRLQLPLKLAWAGTIHKAQGLTLDKVVVDIGKKEFSSGLTFVACSRVRHLTDLLLDPPFAFQRLRNLSNSRRLQERQKEDDRLRVVETSTIPGLDFSSHLLHTLFSPLMDLTPFHPPVGTPHTPSSPQMDSPLTPSSPPIESPLALPPLPMDSPQTLSPPPMDFSFTPSSPSIDSPFALLSPLMDSPRTISPPLMDSSLTWSPSPMDLPLTPSPPPPYSPLTSSPHFMDCPLSPSPPPTDWPIIPSSSFSNVDLLLVPSPPPID